MESTRPLLGRALLALAVVTVALVVAGTLYRTPLRTVNLVNETSETITVLTTVEGRLRVFSAPAGGRATVELAEQDAECSEQSFTIRTPTRRTAELSGRFCQDENHPVRESDLVPAAG